MREKFTLIKKFKNNQMKTVLIRNYQYEELYFHKLHLLIHICWYNMFTYKNNVLGTCILIFDCEYMQNKILNKCSLICEQDYIHGL